MYDNIYINLILKAEGAFFDLFQRFSALIEKQIGGHAV